MHRRMRSKNTAAIWASRCAHTILRWSLPACLGWKMAGLRRCASSSGERRAGGDAGCWCNTLRCRGRSAAFLCGFCEYCGFCGKQGARVAMVYHDVLPYQGSRTIDKLRRRAQNHAMSEALRSSDLGIFTVPVSKIPWVGKKHTRAVSIPVGANLPEPETAWTMQHGEADRLPAIAVFGITGGEGGIWEIASISEALQIVAERLGKLRLVVMGRHSDTAEKALKNLMDKQPIEVSALGVLPGAEIVRQMATCDVLLFCARGDFFAARKRYRGNCVWTASGCARRSGNGVANYRSGSGVRRSKATARIGRSAAEGAFRSGVPRCACGTQPARAGNVFFVEGDCLALCRGVAPCGWKRELCGVFGSAFNPMRLYRDSASIKVSFFFSASRAARGSSEEV